MTIERILEPHSNTYKYLIHAARFDADYHRTRFEDVDKRIHLRGANTILDVPCVPGSLTRMIARECTASTVL